MSNTTTKLLFIIAAIIILIMTLYNLTFVAGQMSDENWYRNQPEGVVIFEVTSGGVSQAAGLMEGDRLVMINGDSIRSSLHAQSFLDSAEPGASLIYTIEREGHLFDVKVNLALAGLRIWVVASIFAGILFLLYGIFIVFVKPENSFARLLALSALLFSFFLMNMQQASYIGQRPMIYQILMLILIILNFLAIAAFSHVSLYFPEKKYLLVNRFWMIYAHYILAGIMIIISVIIAVNTYFFNNYFYIVPLVYMSIVEIVNWKRRRKEYLARIKIIKYSVILLLITIIMVNILQESSRFSVRYLAFLVCILPAAYFYTTIRYRVYDIYIRIRLSLVYTVIQTFIVFAFIFSLAMLIRFLPLWEFDLPAIFITGSSLEIRNSSQLGPELQKQIKQGYLLLFGISLALIFYLFKNRLQKIIDSLFFQQKYDYRNALKRLGELLSSYFTREEISQKSVEQIHEIMKVKGTSLAISNNGQFQITSAKGNLSPLTSRDISLNQGLVQKIIEKKIQLKQDELGSIPTLSDMRGLIYSGTPVISAKNKLEAILITGEKLSESAYNHDDLELLNLFAENLGTALERARLYEDMAEKERLERELEIARDIQLNSLPKCDPDYSGLQICSALAPATEVGGDYYDYLEIDKDRLGVIVGDVVGKGTSGAMHMSKIQGFLQTLKLENLPSRIMFEKLNTLIRNNFEQDFFFTALYGSFNIQKRTANIFRTGHNGLIYYNANVKKINVIEPGGIAFGIADTNKFKTKLKSAEISYSKDDIFVFLTDGFLEAMDDDQQPLGEENICNIIKSCANKDASSIMDQLKEEIGKYSSGIQRDDATGIIVKILH
jgi:sigma-B regulation protein RsbU (phosphoserine phosphatase)